MEELAEKILKELKKSLEKIRVQTTGLVKIQKANAIKQKYEEQEEIAVDGAKETLSSSSRTIEEVVKGQFGSKVIALIDVQSQWLSEL